MSGGGGSSGGGSGPASGSGGDPATCMQASFAFVPKIPTVYLMVDRSGSMFDCSSTTNVEPSCPDIADTSWGKLRDSVLMVVSSLQDQVRFGFAAFTGTNPTAGGTCPILSQVPPDLNNYQAISTLYNSLPPGPNSTQPGVKYETPARQSLDMIGAALMADATPGDKYILFVTDGQPDYCDDSNALCAPDSVIAGLQALKAKGITTIVMGLQSSLNDLPPGILQAFANAGAGEPTVAPLRAGLDTFAFFDQCNGVAGWHADLTASGKAQQRGVTLGTYASTPGPTVPYTPDASNQSMLASQLSQALSGVKSCVFDLSDLDGKSIKVDLTQLDKAHVAICAQPDPATNLCPTGTAQVPLDASNGWRMNTPTQLELVGSACTTWRDPNNNNIDFQFPCQIIVPL